MDTNAAVLDRQEEYADVKRELETETAFPIPKTATQGRAETQTKQRLAYRFIKRIFDLVASCCGLVLLSPVFAIIAVLVYLDDPGPVIHTRICVGRNGRSYKMYKFRSMRKNADELVPSLTPEQLAQYQRELKIDHDPRVTRIGRILRVMSLDELPQLLSIFKGDMSLVGPRPVVGFEADFYGNQKAQLLSVKPGLTGYWQVNGRSNCQYETGERQQMELYYVDHCSLWLDIKILLKTVAVVFRRVGAR